MKIVKIVIILTLLIIDWLIFHDIVKPEESYTITEFLTGIVSIPIIIIFIKSFFK